MKVGKKLKRRLVRGIRKSARRSLNVYVCFSASAPAQVEVVDDRDGLRDQINDAISLALRQFDAAIRRAGEKGCGKGAL